MNLLRRGCRPNGVRLALLLCVLAPAAAPAQFLTGGWEGLVKRGAGNYLNPPDPHGAPGPEGILATVNLEIAYFTKSGTQLWGPVNLQSFWSGVGNTGAGLSDPKVLFDADSRRFFVIMQENTGSRFWLNVAASRNPHPRSSGAADWIFYRLDGTEYAGGNGAGGVNYGGDYPGLAVDGQALYATYRMYAFNPNGSLNGCGCNFTNVALLILDKNRLLNGTGTLAPLYLSGFGLQPVTAVGGDPGNVMYAVTKWNSNSLKIYSVSDPLGARSVNSQSLSITDRGDGPSAGAPQLGSMNLVDPINRTMNNASLVGGDVWFCASVGQTNGPAVAAYYRLRLNGWPASGSVSVVEDGTVGEASYWNFCPAIGVNLAGDVAITWTRSSASTYPDMVFAARTAGDIGFSALQVAHAGQTADNDGRWGDYFSAWPDPNDGSLWLVSEWSRSDTGTWSTWWAQIQMPTRDFYVNWNAPLPFIQTGSLVFPYTTVGTAHANITAGTLHIFGGHYNEQLTLTKAVTLQAYTNGPVVIGAP